MRGVGDYPVGEADGGEKGENPGDAREERGWVGFFPDWRV